MEIFCGEEGSRQGFFFFFSWLLDSISLFCKSELILIWKNRREGGKALLLYALTICGLCGQQKPRYFPLLLLLTLGGLLNEFVSMILPPWKLDSDPIENQLLLEALDRTDAVERTDPLDLTDRFDP